MSGHPILIVSGTNRPGSNAMRIATVVKRHYQRLGIDAEMLSLVDLPRDLFDGSAYAAKPSAMLAIQQRVLEASGLHIITPEYNGSFPGVLKYFIDMLKFPESFDRKPVAFVGEAVGAWGALRSVEQLQLIFGYRNAHVYPDRVFIPGVKDKLDAQGKLTDASLDDRLAAQTAGFAAFVALFASQSR
jgi:chromate reductase, NAD(P)H dehydrogenase (quinone)